MSATMSGFRRILHWGPIIALSIIKCITIMSLYMNSMWWPPNQSIGGCLNQSIFVLLSSLATFNYIMATLTGPGFLPLKWMPKDEKDKSCLQYCDVCEGYKAPRSHHCRKCGRCVKKMDHHCPWINNCVGWANHAYFTSFLAFSIAGSFHGSIILIGSFYRGIHRLWYLHRGMPHLATVQFNLITLIMCIFSLGLAIGVVIALGMLLYFQLKSILTNRTGIEDWITEKAAYRRNQTPEDTEQFVYPYDLGKRKNFSEVISLSCAPIGDGINWPVAEGCDKYTLTREQIAQKAEKRARTKTYKIMRKATGRYLPLFSQGCRVCLAMPCTDEPRIKLQPGDVVRVTRWRKHWLFGERVVSGSSPKRKDKLRGWFPRRCGVELIEPDEDTQCIKHMNCQNGNNKKVN